MNVVLEIPELRVFFQIQKFFVENYDKKADESVVGLNSSLEGRILRRVPARNE